MLWTDPTSPLSMGTRVNFNSDRDDGARKGLEGREEVGGMGLLFLDHRNPFS